MANLSLEQLDDDSLRLILALQTPSTLLAVAGTCSSLRSAALALLKHLAQLGAKKADVRQALAAAAQHWSANLDAAQVHGHESARATFEQLNSTPRCARGPEPGLVGEAVQESVGSCRTES